MSVKIFQGNCLEVLPTMAPDSIGAVCTDPPYHLTAKPGSKGGFMGRDWDGGDIAFRVETWREVHRVLEPGAHLVAFGGTRTYHRLTCAIEDAGFEIRDCLNWLYGSGFPKGKGCLKPGWEPIVLARKAGASPLLNVDACRLTTTEIAAPRSDRPRDGAPDWRMPGGGSGSGATSPFGRWPANVVLSHEDGCREVGTKQVKGSAPQGRGQDWNAHGGSIHSTGLATHAVAERRVNADGTETVAAWECVPECAVRLLDEQSGERGGSGKASGPTLTGRSTSNSRGQFNGIESTPFYGDSGGASRFFYCSKASPAERRPYNDHPTVKPLALMQWLVRLVTPKGGTVLDPFLGSGSTVLAAHREGFDAIGIDRDPHAVEIARRRFTDEVGPLMADLELVS